MANEKTRNSGSRSAGSGPTRKEIPGAREADAGGVQECGRKNVCFLKAENLFAKSENVGTERVERGSGGVATVVCGVNGSERIPLGKDVIGANRSEVLAHRLQGAAEDFRDAIGGGVGR